MPDPAVKPPVFEVDCPCCRMRLVIDAATGVLLESRDPSNARKSASLSDAQQLLKEESARIHERYRQIVEVERGRGASMEKKFQDFLEKAKDEPASRPVRDVDLD
jgi:hypothetical protein